MLNLNNDERHLEILPSHEANPPSTRTEMSVLTVVELAQYLKIGRSKAYELTRESGFPVVRIGKQLRIPEQALVRWLEQRAS
jgi:excisionase family DNA binding protein